MTGNTTSADVVQDHEILGEKTDVTHEEAAHLVQLTEDELVIEKKLRRRIDWLILPLVIMIYLLNYIDRNNYAAAKLQGLKDDLNLTGQQYEAGLGIFFLGYILGGIPSNQLLNYSGRPSLFLGSFTIAWGLVSTLTFLAKDYKTIMGLRFLLGLLEAPFFPGVLYYLSKWYTKRELSLRMSIFYCGSLLAGAVGALIAAAILKNLAGERGLTGWQWLYIVEGTITVFFGILVIFVLPDFPHTWSRLSPEMKQVANRRMAIEAAEADIDENEGMSHVRGFIMAMKDPRVHILALGFMCKCAAGGIQLVYPSLTRTLGYSDTVTLLLCAPPYAFVACWSLFHSWMSDRLETRFWFVTYQIPIVIIGYIIFMATENFAARYVSLFLMLMIFSINGTFFAWVASAVPRPPAKRAAAYAYINAIGNSASIWTPFTYRDSDLPYYRLAFGLNSGLMVLTLLCFIYIYFDLSRANKRLERLENEDVPLSADDLKRLQRTADIEGVDLATARRLQKGHRYIL